MSAKQKLLVAVSAVVLLVAGFVVVRGSSENEENVRSDHKLLETPAVTKSTERQADGFSGNSNKKQAGDGKETSRSRTVQDESSVAKRVRVRGGKPVGGVKKIKVSKGERIRIIVSSDQPVEAHLHGYDIERQASPGKPAKFSFSAKLEGVFELELHDNGALIAELSVEP